MSEGRRSDGPPADSTAGRRDHASGLSWRAREVRLDLHGEGGAGVLAAAIGVPVETWLNIEAGVAPPADVLLRFLDATGAAPGWLLHGGGDRYLAGRYRVTSSRPN